MKKYRWLFVLGIIFVKISVIMLIFTKITNTFQIKNSLFLTTESGYIVGWISIRLFLIYMSGLCVGLFMLTFYSYIVNRKPKKFFDIKNNTPLEIVKVKSSNSKNHFLLINVLNYDESFIVKFPKKIFNNEIPEKGDYKKEKNRLIKLDEKWVDDILKDQDMEDFRKDLEEVRK
jgi:hypothetical protein